MKNKNSNKNIQQLIEQYKISKKGLVNNIVLNSDVSQIRRAALLLSLPAISVGTAFGQCQGAQTTSLVLAQSMTAAGLKLDVEGDGPDDFEIYRKFAANLSLRALGTGQVLTSVSNGQVKRYAAGETIDGSNFNQYGGRWFLAYNSTGVFLGQFIPPYPKSGFIGIKKDGKYGFIQLTIVSGPANPADGATPYVITVSEIGLAASSGENVEAGDCVSLGTFPVELIEFKAKASESIINLMWQTATETNNAGFEIERSEDGQNFRSISWVEGHGTTLEQQEYLFDDKDLRAGKTYYYRLKQIDYNGAFEYSQTVSVTLESDQGLVGEFFPNPVSSGFAKIEINAQSAGDWSAHIFDVSGKAIRNEQQFLEDGKTTWQLDVNDLAAGIYFVKFGNGQEQQYRKLVVE